MIASRRTSAHVHSVFEVNFGRVSQIREAKKAEYERAGAKLTYLSFILKAAIDAKITLSSEPSAKFDIELPNGDRYQREIPRQVFELLIEPVLSRTAGDRKSVV